MHTPQSRKNLRSDLVLFVTLEAVVVVIHERFEILRNVRKSVHAASPL